MTETGDVQSADTDLDMAEAKETLDSLVGVTAALSEQMNDLTRQVEILAEMTEAIAADSADGHRQDVFRETAEKALRNMAARDGDRQDTRRDGEDEWQSRGFQ